MQKRITIEVTADNAEEIINSMMDAVCCLMTDTVMGFDRNDNLPLKITAVLDEEVQISDNSEYLAES